MKFESPLDKIKKMNADNKAQKAEEEALEKEQELQNQENIDEQYKNLDAEKDAHSTQIEGLKQRIAEISGTQEEMIAQYRETINEAKKDPETLKYVKENFDEIFGEAKLQWKETGAEKISNINQQIGLENSIDDLDNQMKELYPETSEGQESNKNDLENTNSLIRSLESDRKRLLENISSVESAISYKNKEKEGFADAGILKQQVEYVDTKYGKSLKIISKEAEKYSELWDKLKISPNISGKRTDLPELLQKFGYTPEEFRKKEQEITDAKNEIRESMNRYHSLDYYDEGINGTSFPRILMNIDNAIYSYHKFNKGSLEELIDMDLTIKQERLEGYKEELEEINEKLESLDQNA